MTDFIHPAYGCTLTSPFGPRKHPVTGKPNTPHKGVDFAKAGNIPILAAANGTIREAREIGTYGFAIVIEHNINGKRMDTVYAHLHKGLEVKKGDKVRQGQRIGFMGNTGASTGQHLHFELHNGPWLTGQPNAIDPWPFINGETAVPAVKKMKVSNDALTIIKKWEGFEPNAYLCPAKVWTVGYGTTKWADGKAVKKGDKITLDAATKLLEKQVNEHSETIQTYVTVALTQSQYDALSSFQYNLGKHILRDTALLKYLNSKAWDKATAEMLLYNKANGKVLTGLVNRRKDEVALFKKTTNKVVEELVFSSAALETSVKNLIKDKAKQKEVIKKASDAGIINKTWVDKYNLGQQKEHDILGVCVLYTLSK